MILKQVKRAMILTVLQLTVNLSLRILLLNSEFGLYPSQEPQYLPFNNPIK